MRMTERSDLELIEEFRSGNHEGFNEIVRRYQERIYWTARRVMGSHEDADDITQEVFIRAFKGLAAFRGESSVFTWLYRITTNLSLNALRRKRVKDFLQYDEVSGITTEADERSDSQVLKSEYETILRQAVSLLPPKQKLVFSLRYYDEMPYEEMSGILHRSVGGLKANYFHALRKIQQHMRKELGE
jgi:RNA polymerase sigma-70 factor (ECF subfamily)